MAEPWHIGLRGARCYACGVAWAWKNSGSAPLEGARCPGCGAALHRTALAGITRIPVRAGFPWYRSDVGPAGSSVQHQLEGDRASAGAWYTFDTGPGLDSRQEGRRLVRVWAGLDAGAPPWLEMAGGRR
jgi:hypothetical protein